MDDGSAVPVEARTAKRVLAQAFGVENSRAKKEDTWCANMDGQINDDNRLAEICSTLGITIADEDNPFASIYNAVLHGEIVTT